MFSMIAFLKYFQIIEDQNVTWYKLNDIDSSLNGKANRALKKGTKLRIRLVLNDRMLNELS